MGELRSIDGERTYRLDPMPPVVQPVMRTTLPAPDIVIDQIQVSRA